GTNVSLYNLPPHPASGSVTNITSNSYDIDFWITNVTNATINATLTVTNISDANGCSNSTLQSASVEIKPMPAIGPFE
ncbi:MAG TPA: hypothetical protein PLB87_10510, partial [Prolixibacteraceae bacterium]|nr:hypothetical protein [Prolixibacteraceae bacterium]